MFLLFSSFMLPCPGALAFDFEDAASIGAAYTTHLFFHEMGHQVVAEEVGADSLRTYAHSTVLDARWVVFMMREGIDSASFALFHLMTAVPKTSCVHKDEAAWQNQPSNDAAESAVAHLLNLATVPLQSYPRPA